MSTIDFAALARDLRPIVVKCIDHAREIAMTTIFVDATDKIALLLAELVAPLLTQSHAAGRTEVLFAPANERPDFADLAASIVADPHEYSGFSGGDHLTTAIENELRNAYDQGGAERAKQAAQVGRAEALEEAAAVNESEGDRVEREGFDGEEAEVLRHAARMIRALSHRPCDTFGGCPDRSMCGGCENQDHVALASSDPAPRDQVAEPIDMVLYCRVHGVVPASLTNDGRPTCLKCYPIADLAPAHPVEPGEIERVARAMEPELWANIDLWSKAEPDSAQEFTARKVRESALGRAERGIAALSAPRPAQKGPTE